MSSTNLYAQIAVFCGAVCLAAAFVISRKTQKYIPESIQARWLVMDGLILFFLLGYIAFLISMGREIIFSSEMITGTIFLTGSFFVLLVINVSKVTIKDIRERERQVFEMNRQLNNAYDSTIEGWGRALELRDEETEGHTKRVATLTVKLARQCGLSGEELVQINRGALLHDIGKMSISDSILMKNGSLTQDERLEMEKHPLRAYGMLSSIDYLVPALDIPLYHHEKWDGTGYPHGLKGEKIPIAARIFALVDVWDALTSERRYHSAWDTEKACDHIKSLAGTHFDPEITALFLQMVQCDAESTSCKIE